MGRGNKGSRKKRIFLVGGGILALAAVTACFVGARLRPSEHFSPGQIPVATAPINASTTPPVAKDTTTPTVAKPKQLIFNVLLLGIDARSPNQPARTDTIILIHVNLNTHQYNIMSIPRDTRVELPGYGETKITHAQYLGTLKGGLPMGIHDVLQAVSNFTGLEINYYAETSFWGLEDLVDSVGGVTVDVHSTVNLQDFKAPSIPAGPQHLNGVQVHELVGERHTEPQGDFTRQEYQEEVLVALAKQLMNPSSIVHLPSILRAIPQYLVATNMSDLDMLDLALASRPFQSNQVHYYQVPGRPGVFEDPVLGQKLDYWVADMSQVDSMIKLHFQN